MITLASLEAESGLSLKTTGDAVHLYAAVLVHSPLTMPCGAVVVVESVNQKCPNSGNCAAGHKECWVFKTT